METAQQGMPHKLSRLSLYEALGGFDLAACELRQSSLEFDESAPFDKIMPDYDVSSVIWEKTLTNEDLGKLVSFPLYIAYLKALMPELYSIHPGVDGKVLIKWITHDIDDVLNEAYLEMSETTRAVAEGSVPLGSLLKDFFTPEIISKVQTLQAGTKRLATDEIIRILMSGESVALVDGML